jgi:hypothetical protein
MPKFIISWGLGDLDNCEIVEAKDLATAENIAYDAAVEEAASVIESKAETYTRALALEYGLDDADAQDDNSEEETNE